MVDGNEGVGDGTSVSDDRPPQVADSGDLVEVDRGV